MISIAKAIKPYNISEGDMMLFGKCPTMCISKDTPARIEYNLMTGDWMTSGQSDGGMYACDTISGAYQLAQTINHYEATGEQKKFSSVGAVKKLIWLDEEQVKCQKKLKRPGKY